MKWLARGCPFCDGRPVLYKTNYTRNKHLYWIECNNDAGANIGTHGFNSIGKALAVWNNRTNDKTRYDLGKPVDD